MASIETRTTSTGDRRYRVSRRQNGFKRSRTSTQLKDARRFRDEVDVASQLLDGSGVIDV